MLLNIENKLTRTVATTIVLGCIKLDFYLQSFLVGGGGIVVLDCQTHPGLCLVVLSQNTGLPELGSALAG